MPENIKSYGQYQNEVMKDGVVAVGAMTEKIPMEAPKTPVVHAGGSAEELAASEKKNQDFESLSDEEKKKRMWG